jgi:hypothetical protein
MNSRNVYVIAIVFTISLYFLARSESHIFFSFFLFSFVRVSSEKNWKLLLFCFELFSTHLYFFQLFFFFICNFLLSSFFYFVSAWFIAECSEN